LKSRYYFSASIFAKEYLANTGVITSEFETQLETLILKTGTTTFMNLSDRILNRPESPSLSFIAGIKFFQSKDYASAVKRLAKVPTGHRFGPEARIVLGSAHNLLGEDAPAIAAYDQCREESKGLESQADNEKLKRYFAILAESCTIHKARMLYRSG